MGIYKLEHLLDDVIDYRGKTPKKLNGKWAKEGYRTISAMNVKKGMLVKKKSIRYVNEDIYNKWMKKEVEKNDILLTSEAPLGEVMLWDSNEKIVLGQRLFCLKVNEDLVYPKFLYALMQTELFYKKLIQKQSGTTVFGIRQPQLLKIRINLPEMKKQIDIGDKYYNLELKNKNNNVELDSLIDYEKFLFHKWFVKFNFPNENGDPYQENNGEFKEIENRSIPKKWEIDKLSNHISYEKGVSYRSQDLSEDEGTPMINLKSFTRNGEYNPKGIKYYNNNIKPKKKLEPFSLAVACTDVTNNEDIIGSAIIIPNMYPEKKHYCVSMDLASVDINSKEINKWYIKSLLSQKIFNKRAVNFSNGTNVLHLDIDRYFDTKVVIPDKKVLRKYTKIVSKIEKKKSLIYRENEILKEMRELLIHKLI